jgi:hypothetical protein
MQYWVFYIGGVGGDGFANLLEHADNIEPVDDHLCWRWRVSQDPNKIMFDHPAYTNDDRFLRNHNEDRAKSSFPEPFDLTKVELLPNYVQKVFRGINTVIATHPWLYNFDPRFKHWNKLEKDQCKILLYSKDVNRIVNDFCDKHGLSDDVRQQRLESLTKVKPPYFTSPLRGYQTMIDIDRAWEDWEYLNDELVNIGINLNKTYYDEYLIVSKRGKVLDSQTK